MKVQRMNTSLSSSECTTAAGCAFQGGRVLKFGGTSVGTPASIRNVKRIVEAAAGPVIVVVSALGGVTDRLLALSQQAKAGG